MTDDVYLGELRVFAFPYEIDFSRPHSLKVNR